MDLNLIISILIVSWVLIFIFYLYWAYLRNFYDDFFYLGLFVVIALQTFGYIPHLYSDLTFYNISWLISAIILTFFELFTVNKIIKKHIFDNVFEDIRVVRGLILIIISYHSFLISLVIYWIPSVVGIFSVIWIIIIIDTLIPILYYARENLEDALINYLFIIIVIFLISYLFAFSNYMDITLFLFIIGVTIIILFIFRYLWWYRRISKWISVL